MGQKEGYAIRISLWNTIQEAFSAKGRRKRPARWSGSATEVVYASSSTALAILEILNYASGDVEMLEDFSVYEILFNTSCLKLADINSIGDKWREPVYNPDTQAIGDICYIKNQAPVLGVPSAVIGTIDPVSGKHIGLAGNGMNYLLFPKHPEFKKIDIHGPYRLRLDQRLINQLAAHDILVESLRKQTVTKKKSR